MTFIDGVGELHHHGEVTGDAVGYEFFLSYSRRDRSVARPVARALRRLAIPWYRPFGRRVFRDEEALLAGRVLEREIRDALERSSMLVVLLSSATREHGGWVTREVLWWSDLGKPADRLVFVVAEGQLAEVLPPDLVDEHGGGERLYVDLSAQVARRRPPSYRSIVSEMAGVVAALTPGSARADVYDEDRRQHRRALRAVVAASVAAVLGLAAAGAVAVREHGAATSASRATTKEGRLREEATIQRVVRDLTAEAEQQRDLEPQLALRLNIAATAIRQTPQAMRSLVSTLAVDRQMAQQDAGLGPLHDLALSPDGRQVLVAGDKGAQLWAVTATSTARRATVAESPEQAPVRTAALPADGTAIVSSGPDASVYDISQPSVVHRTGGFRRTRNTIVRVCTATDGGTAVVVNLNGEAQLYDLSRPSAPALTRTLPTLIAPGSAALAGNGSVLAIGSDLEHAAELFDLRHQAPKAVRIPYPFTKPISTVAVSADGSMVAVAGNDARVTVWNTKSPAHPVLRANWKPGIQHVLAFSPNGRHLAGGGLDGRVTVWNLRSPARPSRLATLLMHTSPVTALAFTADAHTLWTAGEDGIFSALRLELLPEPAQTAILRDATADVFAAAYSPRSDQLVTGGNGLPVERWDTRVPESPRRLADLPVPHDQVATIAWSADGAVLAMGDGQQVIITDAAGRVRHHFTADPSLVTFVAFTADARYVITAGNDHRIVLRTLDGTAVHTLATQSSALAMSSNGVLALTRDTRHVSLIDLSQPRDPRAVPTTGPDQGDLILDAAFSPDGTLLASTGRNHRAVIWNITRNTVSPPLSGFRDSTAAAAFNPSGWLLAVGSFDHTVEMWDVHDPAAPLLVARLNDQEDYIMDLAFSHGGQLATVGRDGRIFIYDTRQLDRALAAPRAQACALAGGGLDRSQWDTYLKGEIPWRNTCP